MARIFFVLVLVAVCIAGLGFYLGWFHLGSEDADGKTNITVTVDKNKIKADEKTVLDKVHGVGHPGTAKTTAATDNGPGEAAPQNP